MKVIKCVDLKEMPFDRWDFNENRYIHATGYKCQFEDGSWQTEYDDDDFVYADDCVYESEWDDSDDDDDAYAF